MTPVEPRPAASVVLVRAGVADPIEAYLIRRHPGMRFLGGYYAFPGGKVDPADSDRRSLARCRGLSEGDAGAIIGAADPVSPLAYWVAAARELLEETGLLLACDARGAAVDPASPAVAAAIDRGREDLMTGRATFAEVLDRAGWRCDVGALHYLSHFITPAPSPIRFSARFFLCPLPPGQAPRLYAEETTEGFWIGAADGYRRFRAGELPMAEPAEYALGYLAQFGALADLWTAHADRRHKFHGIIDRTDLFYGDDFDWATGRRAGEPVGTPPPHTREARPAQ